MAKVYNAKKNEIWWEDDIVGVVEDAWWEVLDVLNAKRQLDGHSATDQWLMKVEVRLRDLINTLNDNPIPTQELLSYKQIL